VAVAGFEVGAYTLLHHHANGTVISVADTVVPDRNSTRAS
jgi:hypothetical protein